MNSCSLLHLIYGEITKKTGSNIPENNGTVLCTRGVELTKKTRTDWRTDGLTDLVIELD